MEEDRLVASATDGIDEAVMHGADVHLEKLDDGLYMLIIENKHRHWHLNIGSAKGKVAARLYEGFSGPTWQRILAERNDRNLPEEERDDD